MNKFSFCSRLFLVVLLFSCSKHDGIKPTPDPTPVVTLNEPTLIVGAINGNIDSFIVQSNVSWNLTVDPASTLDWLQLSTTKGSAGTTTVRVSVTLSNSSTLKTAAITVKGPNNTSLANLNVTQKVFMISGNKLYGGSSGDAANAFAKTLNNGLIVAGLSGSSDGDVSINNGSSDFWILDLDATGNKLWEKSFGGSDYDNATGITVTTDGGFVAAGYTNSNDGDVTINNGGYDFWIVKLDVNGNKLWQKSLGGSGNDYATATTATPDGGTIIVGYTESNDGDVSGNHGDYDFWIVKLDANGNKLWDKVLGGLDTDIANCVTSTPDGGFAIAGGTNSLDGDVNNNHGGTDIWVVKLNATGNFLWQKTFGGSQYETANAITSGASGELFIAGATTSIDGDINGQSQGMGDAWVVKLDVNGDKLWQRSVGGSKDDIINSVVSVTDGGIFMAGYTYSSDGDISGNHGGLNDGWIVKLDPKGKYVWQRCLGGSGEDRATCITSTSDESISVAGFTYSNDGDMTANHGSIDYWVMKLK